MNNLFKDLIIFELANNHQGSIDHAKYIIEKISEAAKKYGINAAVKFQYRNLNTFIHPYYKDRTDVKHISRFYATQMNPDSFLKLTNTVKKQGLLAICTPFDEDSIDLCLEHEMDILKVASCSSTDWPLLEKISKSGKPVIISTGGKTFNDIDKIYNFFTHRQINFALLHCIGMYPVQNHHVQLHCIDKMINRYPQVPIGYSGHEDPNNLSITQMAIAKGISILERHVGHTTPDGAALNSYSIEIDDIELWIKAILDAKSINGIAGQKWIEESERVSLQELARGCYCTRSIKKGDTITRDRVYFAMPCGDGQTTSGQFVEGMIASKDYNKNEALFEQRLDSPQSEARNVIHDVKSMLYEAKIVVGNKFRLELSHQYGLMRLREFGAVIVNIINREYCKKIIVVLPGQQHPTHHHKLKEESFQVLAGVLQLTINGMKRNVLPGEIYTVNRNENHAFCSEQGCIFEEISTTHMPNDSYYEDPKIARLDPMERKTVLEEW
jgi:N-acetylneuraminate synthase